MNSLTKVETGSETLRPQIIYKIGRSEKMLKKRVLSVVASILSVVLVIGCSSPQQQTAPNESVSQAAELPNEEIILSINNHQLNLGESDAIDSKWYDVTTLAADAPNIVTAVNIPQGVELQIDGQKIEEGNTIEITIDHMAKDIGIPIIVTSSERQINVTGYIRTLNYDIPEFDFYVDKDVSAGVYYTISNKWMIKWDNQKQEYIYFNNLSVPGMDFKCTEIGGEIYYSYLLYKNINSRPNYTTTGGYNYCSLQVLDKNYQLVDEVTQLSTEGSVKGDWPLEGYDYIILDKGHYIVLGYVPAYVNNIDDEIPHSPYGVKVLNTVIQEIKDGKLIWEWNSIDYPEFYTMSIESNDWFNSTIQWDDYMHINSITVDPKDGNIVCSARHLNAVFEIDKQTKELNWVLGGNIDEFGLTEEQKFKRQHFARYTDTGELVLFDNQTDFVSSGYPEIEDADVGTGYPRVVIMKLDEDHKKLLEYTAYDMGRRTGEFMGSASKTGDDTYLIGWGGSFVSPNTALFTEVDFANNKILCEAVPTGKTNLQSYRVYKFDR